MKNTTTDVDNHLRGKSLYIDDYPVLQGTLYITIFPSSIAHGRITKLDISLAENLEGDPTPVGFTEASILTTEPFFIVSRILHIHSVYVLPSSRRVGIGKNLIQEAINWGRKQSCLEAKLNTLVWNPARSLYKQLGFQVREYRMSIDLVDIDGS